MVLYGFHMYLKQPHFMHTKALNICRTHDDPLWFLNSLHHGFSLFHANQCFCFQKNLKLSTFFSNSQAWLCVGIGAMVFNRASSSLFLGREVANDVARWILRTYWNILVNELEVIQRLDDFFKWRFRQDQWEIKLNLFCIHQTQHI